MQAFHSLSLAGRLAGHLREEILRGRLGGWMSPHISVAAHKDLCGFLHSKMCRGGRLPPEECAAIPQRPGRCQPGRDQIAGLVARCQTGFNHFIPETEIKTYDPLW